MSSASSTYILNELPLLQERLLILSLIASRPRLYLVAVSLKFFNLPFERILQLFLLRGICCLLDFVVNTFKGLNTLSDFLVTFVNLLLQFSCGHCSEKQLRTKCDEVS